MSVWAFINQKGGSGKTTLLVHLAVAAMLEGHTTAVLDLDPQRSAEKWSDLRIAKLKKEDPVIVASTPVDFKPMLSAALEDNDFVFIDTAGYIDKTIVGAAAAADVIIIPTRTNSFDRTSLIDTLEFLDNMRAIDKAVVVINAARNDSVRAEVEDIAANQFGAEIISVELKDQAAFAASLEQGKGVGEIRKTSPAAKAVARIFAEICRFEDELEANVQGAHA